MKLERYWRENIGNDGKCIYLETFSNILTSFREKRFNSFIMRALYKYK